MIKNNAYYYTIVEKKSKLAKRYIGKFIEKNEHEIIIDGILMDEKKYPSSQNSINILLNDYEQNHKIIVIDVNPIDNFFSEIEFNKTVK